MKNWITTGTPIDIHIRNEAVRNDKALSMEDHQNYASVIEGFI